MNLFRLFFMIMISATILAETAYADQDCITEINLCFEKNEISKGYKMLSKKLSAARRQERIGDKNKDTELYSALILAQAQFYENYVGDLKTAKLIYKQIPRLGLSDTSEELLSALASIKRIDAFNSQYSQQLQFLEKINCRVMGGGKPQYDQEAIDTLSDFISSTNNEQLLAFAHYYLSRVLFYGEQQNSWLAYKAICKSMELRPGIRYYLPAEEYRSSIYTQWLSAHITRLVWAAAAILLIFIALVFYSSRPWQWLNFRMVIFVIVVNLLSVTMITLLMSIVLKTATLPDDYMSPPVYFRTDLGNFNNLAPAKFFLYTLTALGGTICLVASTLRFKHRRTWKLINVVVAGMLFATIYSVFFLRYCKNSSGNSLNSFYREKGDTFSYLSGTAYFRLRDIRPFVLTNPRVYPDLGTIKMDEPIFEEWIKKQNKIIDSSRKPAKK